MSGELLRMLKWNITSSLVSESCLSGKLLKQIAERSAVARGVSSGYKSSISGPSGHEYSEMC